jgi:hypothetical protein
VILSRPIARFASLVLLVAVLFNNVIRKRVTGER